MLMSAPSHREVLLEAGRGQPPLGERREGAQPREDCWDAPTQPQEDGASEGFIGGAGI
jgi:hypothetical protein